MVSELWAHLMARHLAPSLNPCFDGIWYLSSFDEECELKSEGRVLILVLMGYGI